MYRIYFTNLFYYGAGEYRTVADALAAGKVAGFEFAVHGPDGVVAGWSVFGGTRWYS